MAVYRWSKTINAYQQWAFIFEKELPCEIITEQAALTAMTYVRDVIAYAHANNLKGADWYRKVTVSAIGTHTLYLRLKAKTVTVNTYPSKSIFEIMGMIQDGALPVGYKFISLAPMDELTELLDSLDVSFRIVENNLVEITNEI
jgi:hypothetical protein